MEIVKPLAHGDLDQVRFELRGPYFCDLLAVTPTHITFDGYFRYDAELFSEERPIHRFMEFQGHTYLLAFTHKRRLEDTSTIDIEEEGGGICLSPTEVMEVRYRVVEKDPPNERWSEIIAAISAEDDELRERMMGTFTFKTPNLDV